MDAQQLQRDAALANANRIRFARARLRKELSAADKTTSRERAIELLKDPPEYMLNCKVRHFLRFLPGIGEVRGRWICVKLRLTDNATIELLGDRRRAELAIHIAQTGA